MAPAVEEGGTRDSGWALLKEYASRMEADLDIATLGIEEIPALVRGPEAGIFGPGFAGSTTLGVRVFVPEALLEIARDLLGVESPEA